MTRLRALSNLAWAAVATLLGLAIGIVGCVIFEAACR